MDYKSELEKVLWNNEIKANKMTTIIVAFFSFFNLAIFVKEPPSFFSNKEGFRYLYLVVAILGFIVIAFAFCSKFAKKCLKSLIVVYFEVSIALISTSADTGLLGLLMCLPLVISCRYYNEGFTVVTGLTTSMIMILLVVVIGVLHLSASPNLNYVVLKPGIEKVLEGYIFTQISYDEVDLIRYMNGMSFSLLIPALILLITIGATCIVIARKGKDMIIEQTQAIAKDEKMKAELNNARAIQVDMLKKDPLNNEYINILGNAEPAKMVGGDFYDYIKIDDKHIAFVIGDVSDKGIPAALFMAKTMAFIDGYSKAGIKANEVFNFTNTHLCENNASGMFVTSFIGIINLETGEMECVNAGHCIPLIVDEDGCRYQRFEPDLFLGGMDDTKYTLHKMNINKGSRIILYTDGVIEAMDNKEELYGENRLLNYVQAHTTSSQEELLTGINDDIRMFANGYEQNDDITLLIIDYK